MTREVSEASRPVFETERLRAVRWHQRHAEAAYAIYSREDVVRYLANPTPHPSVAYTREWLARLAASYDEAVPGQGYFAVERRDDGALVGAVLVKALPNGSGEVEIGWTVAPWEQGKGYATEAGTAAARYAFDVLGEALVYAIVEKVNTPSIRVCERIGMHYVGVNERFYEGWPGELFAITPDELRAAERAAPRR